MILFVLFLLTFVLISDFNNTWTESNVDEPKAVETRDAVVLPMPPIDTYPEPSDITVKWYTGQALSNPVQSDETFYISKNFDFIILDVQSWYNNRTFQVEFTNKFGDQASARSRIFRLVVSCKCQIDNFLMIPVEISW